MPEPLTTKIIRAIFDLDSQGVTGVSIGKDLGVSQGQVSSLLSANKRATPEVREALLGGEISAYLFKKLASLEVGLQPEHLEKLRATGSSKASIATLSAAAGGRNQPGVKDLQAAREAISDHLGTHERSYLSGLLCGLQYALGELDAKDLFPDSERLTR